ncbi:MAG: imidazole glycerol phosphate synthase subunit HisH, partial [Eggerthellaceae bacterium]|nr:imidazole glycerol phosphate synthase subunit HisH [Eggerthellaceae bacterium]
MIAVIDYHKGNLMSVERGLEGVGAHAFITDDASEIARADAIVLPGVGAFADAMESMRALGQDVVVKDRVACGVPFLGICLGLHLMFSEGEEGAGDAGTVAGLGLIDGVVRAMPRQDTSGSKYKVPHVGWNSIHPASSIRQDVELGAHAEG